MKHQKQSLSFITIGLASICTMLAGGVVASLPTPMAWFTMAEVEGAGTVIDASGNGRNLTLGANVQIVDTERHGKALKFSGTTAD